MKLLGATASDVGNVREANQDRVFFRGLVAALADGMGGHQGGERAAELAIGEFEEASKELTEHDLVEVVLRANRQVHGHAADNGLPGMGTTLVALTLHDDETITVANVGDSRAYWLRGDYMGQVTEDHSFVEDLVRQGRLTPEEAATHPQRNILTRAVGIGAEVEVDRFPIPEPAVGDRFLLCSDGLFNELTEEEILEILLDAGDPPETANALVEAALQTPCRDNVTVAVVDIVADDDPRLGSANDDEKLREAKVITAPIPVVRKSVLHESESEEGAALAPSSSSSSSSSQSGSGQTATLLREQVEAPSDEDPELYLDTHELQVIEEPELDVRPRSKIVLGLMALVILGGLAVGGYFVAQNYALSGFFIAPDETTGELSIFEGRRDGFLIFEPELVTPTGHSLEELDEGERALIDAEEFGSLQDAEQFIQLLEDRLASEAVDPEPPPEAGSEASESSSDVSDDADTSDTTQLSEADTQQDAGSGRGPAEGPTSTVGG